MFSVLSSAVRSAITLIGNGFSFLSKFLETCFTFYILTLPSVPVAAVALLIALIAIPRGFPYQVETEARSEQRIVRTHLKSITKRLDMVGTILVLLATVTLAAGFQEADSRFPWRSGYVISLLIISGILWVSLVLWERKVTLIESPREPVLPWRFLTSRAMTGILL